MIYRKMNFKAVSSSRELCINAQVFIVNFEQNVGKFIKADYFDFFIM